MAGSGAAESQDASFDFGGTQRTRYEVLDPQFRAGFDDADQALALQTTLVFDWRRDSLQVFGEIMDSRVFLNDEYSFANGTTTNTLEPVQAFVAWRHGDSTYRLGRFTLDLGKRRLVARNRYRNTVASYTGVEWAWSGADGRTAHAFYGLPMRLLPNDLTSVLDNEQDLDHAARDASFGGFTYVFPTFEHGHRLETYLYHFKANDQADIATLADHLSAGARAYRAARPGEWNYEVEAVLQRGESAGVIAGVARAGFDHDASFLHVEVGYAFDRPWAPNLMLQYDRASGDEHPDDERIDRFVTLFGARRFDFGPTGIYGIAARSNIESPGLRLAFRPADRWQHMLAYRSLRLAAARDAWIGSGWRDSTGAAGRSLGKQLEGSFTFAAIPDRLSIETGFALMDSGRFARQTAGTAFLGSPRYFYTAVTTTF